MHIAEHGRSVKLIIYPSPIRRLKYEIVAYVIDVVVFGRRVLWSGVVCGSFFCCDMMDV
jgi:hypothetical protein